MKNPHCVEDQEALEKVGWALVRKMAGSPVDDDWIEKELLRLCGEKALAEINRPASSQEAAAELASTAKAAGSNGDGGAPVARAGAGCSTAGAVLGASGAGAGAGAGVGAKKGQQPRQQQQEQQQQQQQQPQPAQPSKVHKCVGCGAMGTKFKRCR